MQVKNFLKSKRCACCMHVTWENSKCVLSTCRLLGWPCGHFQHLGPLQTSKLLEKSADGNVPHVRPLQHFQNPCDDICEHDKQVLSCYRTTRQPFCARKPASSVIFRCGHSIQNRNCEGQLQLGLPFRNKWHFNTYRGNRSVSNILLSKNVSTGVITWSKQSNVFVEIFFLSN